VICPGLQRKAYVNRKESGVPPHPVENEVPAPKKSDGEIIVLYAQWKKK